MARTARIKSRGEGTAYYHLMSRASNRQHLFRKAAAKDRLMDLARRAAEFSGIGLVAFAMMDNHYHILCRVKRGEEPVSREEIVRRVGVLKGAAAAGDLAKRWGNLSAGGFTATLEEEADRYRARMNDISEFMKTMKELYAIWYNREYGYIGSVWSGVFKSTMVEGGRYLEYCRRYVMMNPVRAGIARRICDYRWVWGEGESGNEVSQGCLPGVGAGSFPGSLPKGTAKGTGNGVGRIPMGTGCLPDGAWHRRDVCARVAQIGSGKLFGSEGFVRRWISELAEGFHARRVDAHRAADAGFSSHGWRLAKRLAEEPCRAAAC